MKSTLRITQYTITPGCLYDAAAIRIGVEDEGEGEYLTITTDSDQKATPLSVDINPNEWPLVRRACDKIVADIESAEKDGRK